MLPLPPEIASKLNLSRPVSLKISNSRVILNQDSFVVAPDGGVSIVIPEHILSKGSTSGPKQPGSDKSVIEVDDDEPNIIDVDKLTSSTIESSSSEEIVSHSSSAISNDSPAVVSSSSNESIGTDCTSGSSVVDLLTESSLPSASSSNSSVVSSVSPSRRRVLANRHGSFCQLNAGVECLQQIFHYLGVCDLLRVSRVCRLWCQLARQQNLVCVELLGVLL